MNLFRNKAKEALAQKHLQDSSKTLELSLSHTERFDTKFSHVFKSFTKFELLQGISYWNGTYELTLTDKDIQMGHLLGCANRDLG